MTTQEIANKFVEMFREGKWSEIHTEMYSDDIVSVEPAGNPMERVQGHEGLKQKADHWNSMTEEVHGMGCSEPQVAEDWFSVSMWIDSTMKGIGRMKMEEIAVYRVKDGKINHEQFFFTPQMAPQN